MKKRTKTGVLLAVALVCVCAVVIGVFALGDPADEKMRQLGQIDAQSNESEQVAYIGENIKVMQSDLERFTQRIALTTDDTAAAESDTLKSVALREIFCYRAEKAGIPNDDEEFEAWFIDYRKNIESSSNYEDFVSYIDGMGMTPEEYWKWAETDSSIRNEWYSALFAEKVKEDFAAESELLEGSPEFNEAWVEYYTAYRNEAYESENLKKITGD